MNLSAEQIAARKGKLTASRVAVLMKGDREGILRLYREMIGEETEEDLSDVWAVQLGSVTEQLQLDWFERKNHLKVTRRGEVISHPGNNWAACTLDGFVEDVNVLGSLRAPCGYPIEAKHLGGREPIEVIIDRYQPQVQWQMYVVGSGQCALSMILGANEPVVEYIERNNPYIEEMVKRGEYFMMCVDLRKPPVTLDPVAPPVEPTKIINMTGHEGWTKAAERWIQSHGAAETAKEAEKILKSLMPAEAKKAFGCGCRITRDRAGRLSLREDQDT